MAVQIYGDLAAKIILTCQYTLRPALFHLVPRLEGFDIILAVIEAPVSLMNSDDQLVACACVSEIALVALPL